MSESIDTIRSLDDLRAYVHHVLCEKENLLADQFSMMESELKRRGRICGLQFLLNGPRSVRLGAIWAADHNQLYFYDARGERFLKTRLKNRLLPASENEAASAASSSSARNFNTNASDQSCWN